MAGDWGLPASEPAPPGDRDAGGQHLARVGPHPIRLAPSSASKIPVRTREGLIAPHEVPGVPALVREVVVDPQDQVLRSLVEVPDGSAGPPGVPGPEDLPER